MLLLSFGLLIALVNLTHAVTHRVPEDYGSIQAAILASANGDTVLVAEGIYVENIDYRGRNIVVGSHFLLDEDVTHIPLTILDGSQPASVDTGSVVRIINGEDSTTALIGFTITGGTGTKFRDQSDQAFYIEGGGVIIENSDPLIAFNIIVHNEATRQPAGTQSAGGGGIRYGYCSPRIHNNVIMHNSGKYGGGVVSFFADGDLRNNVIANNDGGQAYGGGGVWIGGNGHSTTLINNTIVGNESVLSGGGVQLFGGVLNGHSNIVWGNNANSGADQVGGNAGNIHLDFNCVQATLGGTGNINEYPQFLAQNLRLGPSSPCVDTGNPDSQWDDADGTSNDMGCYGGPEASWFADFGEPIISMSTAEIEFSYTDRLRLLPVTNRGTTLLTLDSLRQIWGFVDEFLEIPENLSPLFTDTIAMLGPEAGSPHLPSYDTLLVHHNALNTLNPVRVPLYAPADVAAELPINVPRDFALHSAYPNPFNPSTTIAFALPAEQLVNLTITDIQGREVAQLVNSRLSAGEQSVEWNANAFASGTYFATLRAGKWQAQTKLTLLK